MISPKAKKVQAYIRDDVNLDNDMVSRELLDNALMECALFSDTSPRWKKFQDDLAEAPFDSIHVNFYVKAVISAAKVHVLTRDYLLRLHRDQTDDLNFKVNAQQLFYRDGTLPVVMVANADDTRAVYAFDDDSKCVVRLNSDNIPFGEDVLVDYAPGNVNRDDKRRWFFDIVNSSLIN